MTVGVRFPNIKVVDGIIGDGHHRYVASLLVENAIECDPHQLNANPEILEWTAISFVDEDWDTEAEIEAYNKTDAAYSDISIETLRELLEKSN